jgi:hypothetical protein
MREERYKRNSTVLGRRMVLARGPDRGVTQLVFRRIYPAASNVWRLMFPPPPLPPAQRVYVVVQVRCEISVDSTVAGQENGAASGVPSCPTHGLHLHIFKFYLTKNRSSAETGSVFMKTAKNQAISNGFVVLVAGTWQRVLEARQVHTPSVALYPCFQFWKCGIVVQQTTSTPVNVIWIIVL